MGRNDICFCGSGKKTKYCHDFNEHSQAGSLVKLYQRIDNKISQHYCNNQLKSKCSKGCSECCYHYFTISDIEFDLILNELKKWSVEQIEILKQRVHIAWKDFAKSYPDYANNLELYGTNRQDIVMKDAFDSPEILNSPCLFLGEDSSCMVYNVRPIICRRFGIAMMKDANQQIPNYKICEKIGNSLPASKWQADIEELEAEIMSFTVIKSPKFEYAINRRRYPIIYFLYMAFIKYESNLNIVEYPNKFKLNREEYINQMYTKTEKLRYGNQY